MNIRFSIITVSYNSEATIRRTIDSIVNQTIQDFEYIIIDGASTDNTSTIINEYKAILGDRLVHVSEPDKGIYDAMNKGINIAKGDIIGIVNSDDWLELNTLELISKIPVNEVLSNTIICGWMTYHYTDGRKQVLKTSFKKYNHHIKKYSIGINHPATFVSSNVYNKVGLFDTNLKISADVDFIIRCSKVNINISFLDNVLTNMSDGGVSHSFSKQLYIDRKYILKKHTRNKFEYIYYILYYIVKNIVKIFANKKLLYSYRKRREK